MKFLALFLSSIIYISTLIAQEEQVFSFKAFKTKLNKTANGGSIEDDSLWRNTNILLTVDFNQRKVLAGGDESWRIDLIECENQQIDVFGITTFAYSGINDKGEKVRILLFINNPSHPSKPKEADDAELGIMYPHKQLSVSFRLKKA
jgi:hypothetical protein